MSDAIPHLHEVADDLCVINSMHTTQFNHAPAELFVHTGFQQPGRPSFGAWTTYGLGSENQDLPGYVVLISSGTCLLYTSPSPRDATLSRMPSSA